MGQVKSALVKAAYFFLCLFFLKRFLRLWVAILCLLRFLPLGIIIIFKCVLVI